MSKYPCLKLYTIKQYDLDSFDELSGFCKDTKYLNFKTFEWEKSLSENVICFDLEKVKKHFEYVNQCMKKDKESIEREIVAFGIFSGIEYE